MLLYANSILFVFNSIKQEIKYEGYSLTDNKLLYSSLLPGISDACSVEQIGGGSILFLDGKNLVLVDAFSGAVKNSVVNDSNNREVVAFDRTFLVTSENGAAQLFNNDGTSVWNKKFEYFPFLSTAIGGSLYWIRHDKGTFLVFCKHS